MKPTTLLGKRLSSSTNAGEASPEATPASRVSALRRAVAGRRGEEVTLPVLGRVFLELPGALAWQEIEAAVFRRLRELEAPDGIAGAAMREAELALRVLAASAKDPDDHAAPFGSLEEWGDLDNDLIGAAWHAFGDVRERLDPVAEDIGADDMVAIAFAVKKKDPVLLRTFGVVKLSRWLASMADQLSTSPTPSSPNTASDSDSTNTPEDAASA